MGGQGRKEIREGKESKKSMGKANNQKGQMSWKSPDGAWVEQASSRRVIRVCCLEEWLPGKKCTTGATAHWIPLNQAAGGLPLGNCQLPLLGLLQPFRFFPHTGLASTESPLLCSSPPRSIRTVKISMNLMNQLIQFQGISRKDARDRRQWGYPASRICTLPGSSKNSHVLNDDKYVWQYI